MPKIEQLVLEGITLGANLPPEPPGKPCKTSSPKTNPVKVNPRTYRQFYAEGIKFSQDIGRDTGEKTKLLIRYFPRRFGSEGNQPLNNKEDVQIGALFNKLMDYSKC